MNVRRDPAARPGRAAAGNERSAPPPVRLPLRAWADQHLYSLLSSLGRLWQRRAATALTVAVMALALALPLLMHVAVRNLGHFGGALEDARELGVFVRTEVGVPGAEALALRLRARADVAGVTLRTPADGLAELAAQDGFGEALALLEDNPLPPVLLVDPAPGADAAAIRALAEAVRAEPEVDFVQLDLDWRERLGRLLALAERLTRVVAVLLGLGALLVVGNTIRLDVQGRADEIAIVQLLGGTDGFVRRPFLYAGCWYGLFAGVLAVLLVAAAQLALAGPVAALAASYGSGFRLQGLDAAAVGAAVAAGIVLGWLGARAASGRQLSRGRPT